MKQIIFIAVIAGMILLSGCSKPLDVCDKMEKAEDKGTCYGNVAFNEKNVSLCDKLTDSTAKDYCFASAAYLGKDSSICSKIKDTDAKQNCINKVK